MEIEKKSRSLRVTLLGVCCRQATKEFAQLKQGGKWGPFPELFSDLHMGRVGTSVCIDTRECTHTLCTHMHTCTQVS